MIEEKDGPEVLEDGLTDKDVIRWAAFCAVAHQLDVDIEDDAKFGAAMRELLVDLREETAKDWGIR